MCDVTNPPSSYAVPQQQWRPVPVSPAGQPLADFLERLAAFAIDRVIISAATFVVFLPLFILAIPWFEGTVRELDQANAADNAAAGAAFGRFFLVICGLNVVLFGFSALATYVYDVEMMFRSGQTVGKRIMKIRVVPLDPSAILTRKVAAKRWLVGNVATIFVPFLVYLDGLWQLWDKPFRQCLHDKFAQTTVVKVMPAPVASLAAQWPTG
jgi:uncharacterized RDD family membrane protein YckC